MNRLLAVEIIFCSKDGNACLYDFGDFAVILTYLVEDAFMPLGMSFEILLDDKYDRLIEQWMKKFRTEDFFAGHKQWSSALLEISEALVEKIHIVARQAEHHFDKDNMMGKVFTEVFPNFPK